MSSDGGPLELDLLAASLRVDSANLGTFVESLAAKLEDALPGLVRVERGRDGLRGPKLVRKIVLDAGGDRLELRRGGGDSVQTVRGRVSGGIVLKTDELDIDAWMKALIEALSNEANRNERTRQALERLLLE
jgi:hypothetical protein